MYQGLTTEIVWLPMSASQDSAGQQVLTLHDSIKYQSSQVHEVDPSRRDEDQVI